MRSFKNSASVGYIALSILKNRKDALTLQIQRRDRQEDPKVEYNLIIKFFTQPIIQLVDYFDDFLCEYFGLGSSNWSFFFNKAEIENYLFSVDENEVVSNVLNENVVAELPNPNANR